MTEGESPASASTRPPRDDILAAAQRTSKFKDRSLDTARRHLESVKHRGHEVEICLLGDSMIERMSTTGQWETLQPWPSTIMLPDSNIQALKEGVANFGCGGDKIEHVLFRVIGDQGNDLRGLANELHPAEDHSTQQRPKLWVIQAGTNNLTPKKGLNDNSLDSMEVLLRTLHGLTCPGSRFLLTGLFYRTDVSNELVDKANAALQALVAKLQQEFPGPHTFEFLPAPQMYVDGGLLEDHVHLNREGYRQWMQTLVRKVEQM
ncbi:SGNH hydrolase-type esterase domain-containing protein [Diaporthe sp. PMI_573]|nr:SGNH hydrolase-type esterase domain-containing protein [Diaporthaceae sp. PMI_573]